MVVAVVSDFYMDTINVPIANTIKTMPFFKLRVFRSNGSFLRYRARAVSLLQKVI